MENVGKFYSHLEYFMAIWNILWPFGKYFMAIWHNVWQFGIVCGHLVYFSHFGMFVPRKIWQPCSSVRLFSRHCLSERLTLTFSFELVRSVRVAENFENGNE
jgi:hypothetical protein